MIDSELDKLLKSASVPARPADFWEDFPRQVRLALGHSARDSAPWERQGSRHLTPMRWAFAAAVVGVCILISLGIGFWRREPLAPTASELVTARIYLREMEGLFPSQVKAIVFEPSGPRLELAERADVSPALPVLVRICGPDGCRSFLTFSGQRIRLDGDWLDVLVDARGHVLVVGAKLAWTSGDAAARIGAYRFAARALGTAT